VGSLLGVVERGGAVTDGGTTGTVPDPLAVVARPGEVAEEWLVVVRFGPLDGEPVGDGVVGAPVVGGVVVALVDRAGAGNRSGGSPITL
jgi:hypothetical protein